MDIKVVCFMLYERGVDIKVVCFMFYKILTATPTTSGLLSGSAVIQLERREGWILRWYVL